MIPQCENSQVRSISREADYAWLAGVLDGEGALSVALSTMRSNREYLDPKIRVYNTDVRMIQKISRIYTQMNVVFFYNFNKRVKSHYKDQLGICVTSQGSCIKILDAVIPYLANKQDIAKAMREVIHFVKSLPRAGATWSNEYAKDDGFKRLMDECHKAKVYHIEPSTTRRRAGEILKLESEL